MKISVVNLGVNNIKSVMGALNHIGWPAHVAEGPAELEDICLIPGIGNFGFVSNLMERGGWMNAIRSHAAQGRPVMGICLGMQLLLEASAEAPGSQGLGLLAGTAQDLQMLPIGNERLPVTGWRALKSADLQWKDVHVYCNHSFGVAATYPHVMASYNYGLASIGAIVGCGNVLGLQFHPEKSGLPGLKLLNNCIDRLSKEGFA